MKSRLFRVAVALAMVMVTSYHAHAQTAILAYSNTTNYSGSGYANGSAALIGANTITRLVADDLFLDPTVGAGYIINGFTFSVANFNTAAVIARPRVRFYTNNGGVPGTVIAAFSFAPISFTASTVQLFNATFSPVATFVTPAPGSPLWAGITFDNNNGTTGATAGQLNNLGQGIFAPPTIGTSNDLFFQTTAAGDFNSNNPAGGLFFFGGNPVADFGWRITAVPEPTTWALIGLGVAGSLAGIARYRRKHQSKMDQKLSETLQ